MKMEYKLIKDCGKGFMLTREPETVTDELIISFTVRLRSLRRFLRTRTAILCIGS